INIRFLFLPTEHDPDSYVREFGADAFRAALAEASALSRFLLDELASRHELGEAEGRASCLHEAAPLLAAIPDCALKVQIERELARQVLLTPEEMTQALAQALADPSRRRPGSRRRAACLGVIRYCAGHGLSGTLARRRRLAGAVPAGCPQWRLCHARRAEASLARSPR